MGVLNRAGEYSHECVKAAKTAMSGLVAYDLYGETPPGIVLQAEMGEVHVHTKGHSYTFGIREDRLVFIEKWWNG